MSSLGEREFYYVRAGRRRKLLNVDLNDTPPNEEQDQVGGPVISSTQPPLSRSQQGRTPILIGPTPPLTIDVEELDDDDDDVIISSPRAFEQARSSSRRNPRRATVIDVESVSRSSSIYKSWVQNIIKKEILRNQRRRIHAPPVPQVLSGSLYVLLEETSTFMVESAPPVAPPPPPPPPPPPMEPAFSCPVCMGPLVEEVTTKCGHIFCKGCIKAAISAQAKCPTCRRKVTNRELIRIYLPTTN